MISIMSGDNNFMENFRVPKKKNKEKLELIPNSDPEQKKQFISKIQSAFKKPDISNDSMKFHKCWSINLSEMEPIFSKKRLSMRNNSSRISESFGFFYLKNESELKKIVNIGKIEVGNLLESCLGNPKMGVSLSQYSDIYHPQVPKSGIILIVKYIKSKVHYLPYDTNPMDPQPNYDCHMMRNSQAIDLSASSFKAFHSTQVFIYEYNEDCDIEQFPSQLLIIGAVQFSWHGNYIYKEQNTTKPPSQAVKRVNTTTSTVNEPPTKRVNTGLPSPFIPHNAAMISSDMMSSTLIIGKSSKNYTQTHRFNVKLLSRLQEQSMLFSLISQNWNLVELLRSEVFEDYLCYTDNQIVRHITLSSTAIIEFPNKFNDHKKMGATFRPKFAFHLTMMPETVKDKIMMSKLIEYLKLKDRVGSVRCNALSNILFYIFPSGKLSRVLGLSSLDASNTLHVVILTEQHPQFLTCNFPASDKREQKYFLEILRHYESSTTVVNQVKSLIPLDTLKKAVTNHILKQKQYFDKVGRPSSVSADKHLDDSDMEVDSNPGEDIDPTRAYDVPRAAPRPLSSLVNNDISAVAPPPPPNQALPVANGLLCRPLPITSIPPPFPGHCPFPITETVTVPPKGLLPGPVANGFYNNPLIYMGCYPPKPFVVPSHPPPVSDIVIPMVAPPPPPVPPVRPPAPIVDSVVPINNSVVCDGPSRVPLGSFQLVYHQSDSRKPKKYGVTHRRPVHLDRGIFQTNEDHCHVSMYNG